MAAVLRPSLHTMKNGLGRRFLDVQYETNLVYQGINCTRQPVSCFFFCPVLVRKVCFPLWRAVWLGWNTPSAIYICMLVCGFLSGFRMGIQTVELVLYKHQRLTEEVETCSWNCPCNQGAVFKQTRKCISHSCNSFSRLLLITSNCKTVPQCLWSELPMKSLSSQRW